MKKILFSLLMLGILLLPADASIINSDNDVKIKVAKVSELVNKDFSSMINKSEMIGNKAMNFQMTTIQYKQMTKVSLDSINSNLNQINIIRNSSDYSDSDKDAMIKKIYLDIETNLYNIDSQSLNYLINLRRIMPSLTYQKYVKSFKDYYNSLNLTGTPIQFDAVPKF